jgi:hypothetical protein
MPGSGSRGGLYRMSGRNIPEPGIAKGDAPFGCAFGWEFEVLCCPHVLRMCHSPMLSFSGGNV